MAVKRTADFFDSYAHDFSAIYGTSNSLKDRIINGLFRKSMMIRYRKTLEGCEPVEGKRVLDIGCGPGHYGIALAKKGVKHVLGLDFAPAMIDLARENARAAGVEEICEFVCDDFISRSFDQKFDYSVLMGFMDYIADPASVIRKAVSITSSRVFFSFPADGGFLAWQRKLRYRRRCDLYLYSEAGLHRLFQDAGASEVRIERIERDFFVTAAMDRP
jgi:2-polyprenyl-3-methyl-5-hydroxy-6-metoxy-1,4-benzoquinol methylase